MRTLDWKRLVFAAATLAGSMAANACPDNWSECIFGCCPNLSGILPGNDAPGRGGGGGHAMPRIVNDADFTSHHACIVHDGASNQTVVAWMQAPTVVDKSGKTWKIVDGKLPPAKKVHVIAAEHCVALILPDTGKELVSQADFTTEQIGQASQSKGLFKWGFSAPGGTAGNPDSPIPSTK